MTRDEPLELRCSRLPLAFLCPGSVRPEGLVVDESGAESELGKASHEGLATLAETGLVPWGETGELARRYQVDERELRALLALGAAVWREVGKAFPDPMTEHPLVYADPAGAFILTGHADVLSWIGRLVRIGDWKTGRRDADHKEQLRGYAVLALHAGRAFGATNAEAFILWVRDIEREHYRMSWNQAEAWLERVRTEIVGWDGRYRAGPHCPHCPRSHECPAGRALVRRDVEALLAEGEAVSATDDTLAALGGDGVVELLARADLAQHVGARVRAAIKGFVQRRGEVVGGGRRLTLVREERRELDVLAAMPSLYRAGLTDDELAEVITLSLAAAERIVAKRAGRGKGAAAARALVAELEGEAAITITTATKLVVKRQ